MGWEEGDFFFPSPYASGGRGKLTAAGLWRLSTVAWEKKRNSDKKTCCQELIQGRNATLLKLLATSFSLEKGASTRLMPCH